MEAERKVQKSEGTVEARDSAQFKEDLAHYSANWIWRALECLVESPEFDPSPKWAAKRLNISVEKVVDGMEGLVRLGYVKREGAKYLRAVCEYHIGPKDLSCENLLSIHAHLAPQIISKLTAKSRFTTWFFLGDDDLVKKYAPQFMALYAQMHREGLDRGLTEVVASEISFAKLTEANLKQGANK